MQVDVEDALARTAVGVEDRPEADVGNSAVLRDQRRPSDELADEPVVFRPNFIQRGDVTFWHDQNVCRRLWIDIVERDDAIVFVHDAGRNLSLDDFAEQAIGHEG